MNSFNNPLNDLTNDSSNMQYDNQFNQFGQSISNKNNNFYQMIMITMIPMLSSAFVVIFQSIVVDIKECFYAFVTYVYNEIIKLVNKHVLKIHDDVNELQIPLFESKAEYNNMSDTVCPEGLPIIWYLNTKIMLETNKLRNAKIYEYGNKNTLSQNVLRDMYGYSDSQNVTSEKNQKKTLLFIPTIKNELNHCEKSSTYNDIYGDNKKEVTKLFKTNKIGKSDPFENLIEIEKDIFMELIISNSQISTYNQKKEITYMVLKSVKKSLNEIGNFYSSIKEEYEKISSDKSGKLYVYNGSKSSCKFGCYQLDKSQSLDNIFLENKESIVADILNLEDKEHYKKYGMKRKIGHLYVGPRGSGKTCLVTALAKLTNRSVVYIPISRIKKNEDLESIIYGGEFNGIKYSLSEVIFILDELDSFDSFNDPNMLKKSLYDESDDSDYNSDFSDDDPMRPIKVQPKSKPKAQTIVINNTSTGTSSGSKPEDVQFVNAHDMNFDKLNIGMVLNLLDGNNDQDGMILIGTANNCDKLDSAIYRNGRMELIKFRYMGKYEIAKMIEHYYEVKLSDEQIQKIRDDRTVQSLSLKNVCLKHIQKKKQKEINIDDLINEINYMFDHVEEINEINEKPLKKVKQIVNSLDNCFIPTNNFIGSYDLSEMNTNSMFG